jgi:hypothetical protein
MRGLWRAVHALAICGVIAVLAWSKAHGVTVVIPYVPRGRTVTVDCSRR